MSDSSLCSEEYLLVNILAAKKKNIRSLFNLYFPFIGNQNCFYRNSHRHTDKQICLSKYSLLWFSLYIELTD